MSVPVVSVMMPCYNAREALPWALGSLLAQSFEGWEVVMVDDGSTDHPEDIVQQAADPRIRLVRLPENRGRGVARQVALDNARGEFIAMLDADDWMYPTRLARQVEVLLHEPSVDLVSAGMAIIDGDRNITGVRLTGTGAVSGPFRGVVCPVPHAPSMYRRSMARGLGYDSEFLFGEDSDFLLRFLQHRRYVTLPSIEYVYGELESVSALKAARAQRFARRRLMKHFAAYPAPVAVAVGFSGVKVIAYRAAAMLCLDDQILRARSRDPSAEEGAVFLTARDEVESSVRKHFSIE
jgi:glycosyltransferase involved in cell wall biosynthesis